MYRHLVNEIADLYLVIVSDYFIHEMAIHNATKLWLIREIACHTGLCLLILLTRLNLD